MASNVFTKLNKARLKFLEARVEKTGKNPSLEFKYFELEDIVPTATRIFNELGLIGVTYFSEESASMDIIDCDAPESVVTFSSPMRYMDSNRGTNPVQALGASHTYLRRYLYMLALDICEPDAIEPTIKADTPTPAPVKAPVETKSKKPASKETRKAIKEEMTAPEGNADELQIKGLTAALNALLDKDPSQEEFIQEIALATNGFTEITKKQCGELITAINEMLSQYAE